MNIAILIPELGGGGAERVAQILGDCYVEKGHQVYYFTAGMKVRADYPVKGKIIPTGIKSCMEGERNDIHRMLLLLCASLKMRGLKHRYQIDAAVSFMEEFNYLNVLSKGKEKVITRVCTILSQRKELTGFLYKKGIVRFLYSHADRVIVMSRYALKDLHCHYRVPLNKMIKIPNPVMDLKIQENKILWPFGAKVIVCVGRLEPVKQQERIIRAFSLVCMKEPDARLVILGKGPQRCYLQRLCEKFQIADSVIFVGFTADVPYYLEHARAFVMASKAEGFPNSMTEAMYYGVPVITTDSPGGCGEIVGKPKETETVDSMVLCRYGILTPDMPCEKLRIDSKISKQEIILGRAMLRILTEDNLYAKYRKQSYRRAGMFSLDRVMGKWDSILKTGSVRGYGQQKGN